MSEPLHAVRWSELIKNVFERIEAAEFCRRHRRRETDFTRQRLLPFSVVMLLLGIDGSMLRLPSHEQVFQVFGKKEAMNQKGGTGTVYAAGRLSVLYDLLNEIGVDAKLAPDSTSEVAMAMGQLRHVG